MKKNILTAFSLVLILSVTSCRIDIREDNDTPTDNSGTTPPPNAILEGTGTLTGKISKDPLVKKGNYTLKGIVKVNPGATITIEPDAFFSATTADVSGLVILKGAKINAVGTADSPIVFTSDHKSPGDWSGITLYGDAPIKGLNGSATALSEDGNNQYYGGADLNSNSGTMKFVRVEYGGRKIVDGTSETNSMTFYAVGAGTTLENLVAYKGTDDGYEFFGGTVSAKNLVSYGNYDDAFDWQDSWSGQNNSNWFAYQTVIGNFGMEIESSSNADNTPPKVSNITLIRESGTNPEASGSSEISAIQFKKQGTGIFSNVYIDGFKNTGGKNAFAVLIQDLATETSQLNTSKIKVEPMLTTSNNDNPFKFGYSFTCTHPLAFTNNAAVKKVTLVSGAWATVQGQNLLIALQ
jgi:hypothetical protein